MSDSAAPGTGVPRPGVPRAGVPRAGVPRAGATVPGVPVPGVPPLAASNSAVKAMLEARSVAVVGASARPGSFGDRVLVELDRSTSQPEVYLVNPRYADSGISGRTCYPSLSDIDRPVDLVLLAVGDHSLEAEMLRAAERGDRSAVIFGNVAEPASLRARVAAIAREAQMAVCGGGCMGFVNVAGGLRAIGYLEQDPLPEGPIALITHSGSAFSALLRADRHLGWTLAVSSGQELVTSTADYLEYALELPGTKVVALLLESVREVPRLVDLLRRCTASGIPVVMLAVGGSSRGGAFVTAHSGALAGGDAGWEALCEATGCVRVSGLDEMVDCLELFSVGRRVSAPGLGLATVHDSGAERTLMADVAESLGVEFASFSPSTRAALSQLLDPGLEVANPLDVWGRGADTRSLFRSALETVAADPSVGAVALAVDLVPELDGDDSYRDAVFDAASLVEKPLAVLTNLPSSLDRPAARRLRAAGVPVLEGTRSGLLALKALLEEPSRIEHVTEPAFTGDVAGDVTGGVGVPPGVSAPPGDIVPERLDTWRSHLSSGEPLPTAEAFRLLADYGVPVVSHRAASTAEQAVLAGRQVGFPCVLKTDEAAYPHKSDVNGVVVAADEEALIAAYSELSNRLGHHVTVSAMAPDGIELALGFVRDPLFGALVVVGAGGVLVELFSDRRVALPPIGASVASRLVSELRVAPLLSGYRGAAEVDLEVVAEAVGSVGRIAAELGDLIAALDINPLRCSPSGVLALDVLVEPLRA